MNQHYLILLLILIVTIPVAIIDIKTYKIPRIIVFPAIILQLMLNLFYFKESISIQIICLALGYIPFFLIWYFTNGKMGLGDAYFSAFLALGLGIENWLLMVFFSSFSALFFALIMMKTGKMTKDTKIAYAPFLGFGALLSLFIPL